MTLAASGAISLGDVNTELGAAGGTQLGMNDARPRGLAWVPSGAIALPDFYSKTNVRITAGTNGDYTGYTVTGFLTVPGIGSAGQAQLNSQLVGAVADLSNTLFTFIIKDADVAQNFWTSLIVNGVQFNSASATYTHNVSQTKWEFASIAGLVNGVSYDVWIK